MNLIHPLDFLSKRILSLFQYDTKTTYLAGIFENLKDAIAYQKQMKNLATKTLTLFHTKKEKK